MNARKHHDYPIEILFDWKLEQIDIPLDWTPEKADDAVTFLGQLEEHIWCLYGDDIVNLYHKRRLTIEPCADNEPLSTDDDIPF